MFIRRLLVGQADNLQCQFQGFLLRDCTQDGEFVLRPECVEAYRVHTHTLLLSSADSPVYSIDVGI